MKPGIGKLPSGTSSSGSDSSPTRKILTPNLRPRPQNFTGVGRSTHVEPNLEDESSRLFSGKGKGESGANRTRNLSTSQRKTLITEGSNERSFEFSDSVLQQYETLCLKDSILEDIKEMQTPKDKGDFYEAILDLVFAYAENSHTDTPEGSAYAFTRKTKKENIQKLCKQSNGQPTEFIQWVSGLTYMNHMDQESEHKVIKQEKCFIEMQQSFLLNYRPNMDESPEGAIQAAIKVVTKSYDNPYLISRFKEWVHRNRTILGDPISYDSQEQSQRIAEAKGEKTISPEIDCFSYFEKAKSLIERVATSLKTDGEKQEFQYIILQLIGKASEPKEFEMSVKSPEEEMSSLGLAEFLPDTTIGAAILKQHAQNFHGIKHALSNIGQGRLMYELKKWVKTGLLVCRRSKFDDSAKISYFFKEHIISYIEANNDNGITGDSIRGLQKESLVSHSKKVSRAEGDMLINNIKELFQDKNFTDALKRKLQSIIVIINWEQYCANGEPFTFIKPVDYTKIKTQKAAEATGLDWGLLELLRNNANIIQRIKNICIHSNNGLKAIDIFGIGLAGMFNGVGNPDTETVDNLKFDLEQVITIDFLGAGDSRLVKVYQHQLEGDSLRMGSYRSDRVKSTGAYGVRRPVGDGRSRTGGDEVEENTTLIGVQKVGVPLQKLHRENVRKLEAVQAKLAEMVKPQSISGESLSSPTEMPLFLKGLQEISKSLEEMILLQKQVSNPTIEMCKAEDQLCLLLGHMHSNAEAGNKQGMKDLMEASRKLVGTITKMYKELPKIQKQPANKVNQSPLPSDRVAEDILAKLKVDQKHTELVAKIKILEQKYADLERERIVGREVPRVNRAFVNTKKDDDLDYTPVSFPPLDLSLPDFSNLGVSIPTEAGFNVTISTTAQGARNLSDSASSSSVEEENYNIDGPVLSDEDEAILNHLPLDIQPDCRFRENQFGISIYEYGQKYDYFKNEDEKFLLFEQGKLYPFLSMEDEGLDEFFLYYNRNLYQDIGGDGYYRDENGQCYMFSGDELSPLQDGDHTSDGGDMGSRVSSSKGNQLNEDVEMARKASAKLQQMFEEQWPRIAELGALNDKTEEDKEAFKKFCIQKIIPNLLEKGQEAINLNVDMLINEITKHANQSSEKVNQMAQVAKEAVDGVLEKFEEQASEKVQKVYELKEELELLLESMKKEAQEQRKQARVNPGNEKDKKKMAVGQRQNAPRNPGWMQQSRTKRDSKPDSLGTSFDKKTKKESYKKENKVLKQKILSYEERLHQQQQELDEIRNTMTLLQESISGSLNFHNKTGNVEGSSQQGSDSSGSRVTSQGSTSKLPAGRGINRVASMKSPPMANKPVEIKLASVADLQSQYKKIDKLFETVAAKFTDQKWLKDRRSSFNSQLIKINKIGEMSNIGTEELKHISGNLNDIKTALVEINGKQVKEITYDELSDISTRLTLGVTRLGTNLDLLLVRPSNEPNVTAEVDSKIPQYSSTTLHKRVKTSGLVSPRDTNTPRTPEKTISSKQTGGQDKEDSGRRMADSSRDGGTYTRVLRNIGANIKDVGVQSLASPRLLDQRTTDSSKSTVAQSTEENAKKNPQVEQPVGKK